MKRRRGWSSAFFSPGGRSLFKFHDAAARNRRASRPNITAVITGMTPEMGRFQRTKQLATGLYKLGIRRFSLGETMRFRPPLNRIDAINIKMRILNRCMYYRHTHTLSLSLSLSRLKGRIVINAIFIPVPKRVINHPHHMRRTNKITIQFVSSILYLFG